MRSWLTALRIARREARRAKGRSALVVALIALPVLGLAFAAATYDTFRLSPDEQATRDMGSADALVLWPFDAPVKQRPDDPYFYESTDAPRSGVVTTAQMLAALPPGSRAIPYRTGSIQVRTATGKAGVDVRELDYGDPLARGVLVPLKGRPPANADEVALTPAEAKRVGATIGGTLVSADRKRSWRVVGLVADPKDLRTQFAVFRPGAFDGPDPTVVPEHSGYDETMGTRWLVDLPAPLSWAGVKTLNRRGILAESRAVLRNPPPESEVEVRTFDDDVPVFALSTIFGGVLVFEVVLLAGPAFAVGARRRRRDLALIAAAGGTPAHLRRVVLADGVVLGVVAAAAGLSLGVLAAAGARPLVRDHLAYAYPGAFRVYPLALAVLAATALLAGTLAALVPAWTAARQSVVSALRGHYAPTSRPRRRWAVAGLGLIGGGGAVAVYGSRQVSAPITAVGLIVAELGLVLCMPTLVGIVARLGGRLPVAPRIALRDIGRNRAAAAPAISAVLAAVAISGVAATMLAAQAGKSKLEWGGFTLPEGYVTAAAGSTSPAPPADTFAATEAALRGILQASAVTPIGRITCPGGTATAGAADARCSASPILPVDRRCPFFGRSGSLSKADQRAARRDPRCNLATDLVWYGGGVIGTTVVAPEALGDLLKLDAATLARAVQTLRDGGVVLTDDRYVVDGTAAIAVVEAPRGNGPQGGSGEPPAVKERTVPLPAYVLPAGTEAPGTLLGPAGVARLGLASERYGLVAATRRAPVQAEVDRLRVALDGIGGWGMSVQLRPPNQLDLNMMILAIAAGVITLGAAAIATGLAAADSRADLTTLAAVGAAPGVRRLLSLSQTGVIAGLGSLIGVVAGVGAAAAVIMGINRAKEGVWPAPTEWPLQVPWLHIAISLVVVPAVAILGAGLLTRSRLPIERRV